MAEQTHPSSQQRAGDPAATPEGRPFVEGASTSTGTPRHPDYATPMHPDEVTVDPLARELGEQPAQVMPEHVQGTLLSDGLSADEREEYGIIDESRHTGSMGRR
jgi:hypothetical protein